MRQLVKKVKNGQDVSFVCSQCGKLIYDTFVPVGKKCEPNWDKIPEKCSCGARLTNRQPIIDINESDVDDNYIDGKVKSVGVNYETSYEQNNNENANVGMNIHEDIEIVDRGYIKDLESAISIDFFDMRLNIIKKENIKIPDNIDYLRMECIKRNISHVESNAKHFSCTDDICEYENIQERLIDLRERYDQLYKKLEDKKRF